MGLYDVEIVFAPLADELLVVQDMVHIADTKVTKRFGDYFIRHITKVCSRLFQALGLYVKWLLIKINSILESMLVDGPDQG